MGRLCRAALERHRRAGLLRVQLADGLSAGRPRGARRRSARSTTDGYGCCRCSSRSRWRPSSSRARIRIASAARAVDRGGRDRARERARAIALAIDIGGWTWRPLAALFGELPGRQPGLGYGAAAVAAASLMFFCRGLALRGWVKGDAFVAGAIGASVALVVAVHAAIRSRACSCARCSIATATCRSPRSPGESRRARSGDTAASCANTLQLGLMTALSATLLGALLSH